MAINRRIRFRIFVRDNFTCQYCGKKAPDTELHVDHRHPVSRGGGDDETNLVTACVICNTGKFNELLPVTLTLADGGPIDGWTYRATTALPLVWVWSDTEGQPVPIVDEIVDNASTQGRRLAKWGPSWIHPARPEFDRYYERMRFKDDGSMSVLLGAYVPNEPYPFAAYPCLTWCEPWRLLLNFDITAR